MPFPWLALALFLVSTGINLLLRPRIKRPKAPGQERPTAQEGRPIPIGYGVFAVAPNVVWWGDTDQQESPSFTTYYLANMVVTLCHGEVDAILDIQASGKSLRFVPLTRDQSSSHLEAFVTSPPFPVERAGHDPQALAIHARQWFGGNMQSGGWEGEARLHWGGLDQAVGDLTDAYYQTLGFSQGSTRPGICFLEFGTAATPFYWGTSPTPQDFTVLLQLVPRGLLLLNRDARYTSAGLTDAQQALAASIRRDANPAEVLYDLITHPGRGLGWDPARIDLDALTQVAITCRDEQLGISCLFTEQDEVEDMVDDVLKHIDGQGYWDQVTGLYTVRLARALPVGVEPTVVTTALNGTTPANARDLTIERPNWRDTTNDLTLTYRRFAVGQTGAVVNEYLGAVIPSPFGFTQSYHQLRSTPVADVVVFADGVALVAAPTIPFDYEVNEVTGIVIVWALGPNDVQPGQQITANYTALTGTSGYVEAVARAQNLASLQQSGESRPLTVDYPFFTNELTAGRHVAKLLNQLSRPLLRGAVTVDRTGAALHPGSVIALTHDVILPDGTMRRVLDALQARLTECDYGLLEDGAIRASWVEDVYAQTVVPILPPPPPPPPVLGTCPAIAIGYSATSAIRVCLYPSDTNFTIKLWRHTSDLGLGVTTGATVVSAVIAGTATSYDDAQTPPAVRYYAAQLIRAGWTDGPLTPWQAMTAAAGTPGACTCTIPTVSYTTTDDGITATLTLTLTDAQGRVQSVEFNTQAGTLPESGWITDAAAPYTATVARAATNSTIRYRITYLACDGTTPSDLTGTVTFPITSTTGGDIIESGDFVYESGNPLFE